MSLFQIRPNVDSALCRSVRRSRETRVPDRAMRIAIHRARKGKATTESFSMQQAFDRAVAKLVRAIPIRRKLPNGSRTRNS